MLRGPIRGTRRGRTSAMASTPSACIAAFSPITDFSAPRSARSSAINAALNEYVRPKIVEVAMTAASDNRWLAAAGGGEVDVVMRAASPYRRGGGVAA